MSDPAAPQDATLKGLSIHPGALSPGFSPGRKRYSAYVPNQVGATTVTAATSQPGATAAVAGSPAGGPVSLEPGRNLIQVEVTAADRRTRETYEVKVVRSHPTPCWTRVRETSPWSPRDSAGELVFGGRMWLFGGYTPGLVSDVWSSADGVEWTQVGTIPCAAGVNIPVAFAHDSRMWVAGNDGRLFCSADGAEWSLATDQAPWRGRYAAGGAVFAGRMWVLGGLRQGELFNDVWSSADGVEWTLETARAPWSKRQVFGMLAVHQDKLWLLGGGITAYHPFRAYTDVWNSPDGRNWTWVAEAPWPRRIWSSAAVYRNRLWVLGGFRSEPTWNNFDDVWYSADGSHWRRLPSPAIWSPRHELSAWVFADRLWVAGGNAWPLTNDVWYLEIAGLTFTTSPAVEEFAQARYTYQAHADFNHSGQPVRYRLVRGPHWLSLDPDTGVLSGTPEEAGPALVELEAYDAAGEIARQSYTLHVVPVG